MHIVFHLSLVVSVLAIVIHCQGARGGSRGGGSSIRGGSYRASRGSTCQGDNCGRAGIITGSVIGGICGALCLIFVSAYCYRRWKGRPLRSNAVFVVHGDSEQSQTYSKDHFETGVWSSRYCQYYTWHGPHQLSLSFDRVMSRVNGQGTDDIGTFIINGTYCSETDRIALTKIYKQGTGNSAENFGQEVTIQLTWNSNNNQFEGKWFIQTNKYRGEDKFELKFKKIADTFIPETKY